MSKSIYEMLSWVEKQLMIALIIVVCYFLFNMWMGKSQYCE